MIEMIIEISVFLGAIGTIFAFKEKVGNVFFGDKFEKIEQKFKEYDQKFIELEKSNLRTTLLFLTNQDDTRMYSEIMRLFDRYKELGGNGLVDGEIEKRKKRNNLR